MFMTTNCGSLVAKNFRYVHTIWLMLFLVIKKVTLSKLAVVKLKGGFLMKSFVMNAPL